MVKFTKVKDDEIQFICPMCNKAQILKVDPEDLEKYLSGALVQDAFPNLSPEDRELFVTGICPDCWNKMFGGEDND